MDRRHNVTLATAAAVASGIMVAFMVRPELRRSVQGALSGQVPVQITRIGGCLSEVKEQLNRIEAQLEHTSSEFIHHISEVGQEAVARYIPADPLAGRDWDLHRSDIAHDLPRMPGA